MSDVRTGYGTSGQALTITLTSLADSATVGRESTVVNNASDKFLDALLTCKVKTHTSGTVAAPSAVFVYCYASVDGGTEYPDTVTGTDAAITINSPTQLKLLGTVYIAVNSTTYKGGPWSVAALYGGRLPEKWGCVVINDSNIALSATPADHVLEYQGIYATVT